MKKLTEKAMAERFRKLRDAEDIGRVICRRHFGVEVQEHRQGGDSPTSRASRARRAQRWPIFKIRLRQARVRAIRARRTGPSFAPSMAWSRRLA